MYVYIILRLVLTAYPFRDTDVAHASNDMNRALSTWRKNDVHVTYFTPLQTSPPTNVMSEEGVLTDTLNILHFAYAYCIDVLWKEHVTGWGRDLDCASSGSRNVVVSLCPLDLRINAHAWVMKRELDSLSLTYALCLVSDVFINQILFHTLRNNFSWAQPVASIIDVGHDITSSVSVLQSIARNATHYVGLCA